MGSNNIFADEAKTSHFSLPLHAMRGIAAVIVLLSHILNRIAIDNPNNDTPFNGSAAVTFFFVLSGLVVGASVAKYPINLKSYLSYGVRRFFRMMPLLFVTVTLGGLYLVFLDVYMPHKFLPTDYGDLSLLKWASAYFAYSMKPNPPIWSIFVELVASALIPIWILLTFRKIHALIIMTVLLGFACLNLDFQHHWNFYMVDFYLGITILLWGRLFATTVSKLPAFVFWLFFGFLVFLFYAPRILFHYEYGEYWFNLIEIVPIAMAIALAYYLPERFTALESGMFKFLGDVSFSLYLVHSLIIILAVNLIEVVIPENMGGPVLDGLLLALLVLPLSFIIADWSYKNIELRFIEIGKTFNENVVSVIVKKVLPND